MFRTDFRPIALAAVVGLGLTACNSAESRNAPNETEPTASIPAGTTMTLTVDDDVASDGLAPGDAFTATLSAPLADAEGRPVLDAGARTRWTVTNAVKAAKGGKSLLAARLASVQVDDAWQPVDATITEVTLLPAASAQPSARKPQTVKTGDEADELIAQVSGTAGAPAMAQPDASKMPDPGQPTHATTTAPATIAVASAEGPAHIDAGTRITVRLTDALVLRTNGDEDVAH